MLRVLMVMTLGAGLFMGAAWQLGLLKDSGLVPQPLPETTAPVVVVDITKLGGDLYVAGTFAKTPPPRRAVNPILLYGVMNPVEIEEVASQVPGRVLFIGDPVNDSAVLAAGSAAFITEPYSFADIYAGRESFVKFYRRLYDGETVYKGQMLAMIEPAKALGEVLVRTAKIASANADVEAAKAADEEGHMRWLRLQKLGVNAAPEELGAAKLTKIKLQYEYLSSLEKFKVAENEKDGALIELRTYEIRPTLQYPKFTIKNIVRQRGWGVKPGDPVVVVQSLERLQAEALIEEQYHARLKDRKQVMATIEPTILEAPLHEVPAHDRDVTCVAVAQDQKIVSGSEDSSVCVWDPTNLSVLLKFDHDAAVQVVACTPKGAAQNTCLAGCTNGNIYLWDLAGDDQQRANIISAAHGSDTSITSLAYSPDGKFFASGASDGTIRIWSADGKPRYAFIPENGVAQAHEDAVTSLHFTPQCRLISAGRDKTLRVWLLKEKGAVLEKRALKHREGNVGKLGVSHDGQWMLFDQAPGRTLKLLSVENQTSRYTLNLPTNATPFNELALFSPDSSLILTASASEGRLQLWKTPDAESRAFEVRQFATRERMSVACAAFAPDGSFAVSGSGHKIYLWAIPTPAEVAAHRITNVPMTLLNHSLDASTRQTRIGFEIENPPTLARPNGRFEAGRPVTIVIE